MAIVPGSGVVALLLVALVSAYVEEDFAFDSDAPAAPADAFGPRPQPLGGRTVQRKWGVPDTTAFVGHLFRYRVPNDAFSGDVASYEVSASPPKCHALPAMGRMTCTEARYLKWDNYPKMGQVS